jgi:LAGLIDADG endonuclease
MRSDAGSLVSREFLSAYISGYADGEGCFSISIAPRATLAVGWEVRPSFSVSQNQDRAEVLYVLQTYFGCGSIRPDRSDKTLKWETRKLDDLVERVVPHFIRYPLLSAKQLDFERFAVICFRMAEGEHRSRLGLISIVSIVRDMNADGRRRYDTDELYGTLIRAEMKG